MCSCKPFFFFAAAHFHMAGRQHFSSSHRRYKIFTFFFQQTWSPLFFISRSRSFSIIHVNVDVKIYFKERIGFVVVVFFLCKSPDSHAHAIYRRNARGLEMQNFLLTYMNGWTHVTIVEAAVLSDVRTILLEPKFFAPQLTKFSHPWCSDAPASRARELRFVLNMVTRFS